jgi:DNA-binding MarR family transcriptional regulator
MTQGKLQHELKKKQPFASPEQEMTLNLLRTADQVQHRFAQLFREHGLTPSQYNILRILRGEGRPLQSMDIAARTITVVPGITGLIDRLEAAGLVTRTRCTEDRRVVHVAITAHGLDVLTGLDEPVLDLHRQVAGRLSREEVQQLNRLLEKARQGCQGQGE